MWKIEAHKWKVLSAICNVYLGRLIGLIDIQTTTIRPVILSNKVGGTKKY